jgi:hypothetical protein
MRVQFDHRLRPLLKVAYIGIVFAACAAAGVAQADCGDAHPLITQQNVYLNWTNTGGGTCNPDNNTCTTGSALNFQVGDFPPDTVLPCGGPFTFAWDMGDGTHAQTTEPHFLHAYAGPGQYAVTATVTQYGNVYGPVTLHGVLTIVETVPALSRTAMALLALIMTIIALQVIR